MRVRCIHVEIGLVGPFDAPDHLVYVHLYQRLLRIVVLSRFIGFFDIKDRKKLLSGVDSLAPLIHREPDDGGTIIRLPGIIVVQSTL